MKNINFRRFLSAVLAVVMISTVALTASVPAFAIDETAIETAPEATPAPPAETAAPMPEETPMDPPAEDIPDDTHRPSDDLDLDVFARTLTIGDNVQINYAVADMGYDNVKMLFFTSAQTEYTFENADLSVDWSYRDDVLGQKAYVFSYTELFDNPVGLDEIRTLIARPKETFQSYCAIDEKTFLRIYQTGVQGEDYVR